VVFAAKNGGKALIFYKSHYEAIAEQGKTR